MTTPTSVFMSGPIEDKNGTFAKQTLGATDLIYIWFVYSTFTIMFDVDQ